MDRDASVNTTLFRGWKSRLAHIAARVLPFDFTWYRGQPIVSFTFDDFPLSAAETGASILKRHGVRGTFYAATGLMGESHELWTMATPDVMCALEADGHEIGLHTHTHKCAWEYGAQEFRADLRLNEDAIQSKLGAYQPETFAYPYGIGNISHKAWLSRSVRGSRSVHPGINAGLIDRQFLKAFELIDSALTPGDAAGLIDNAVNARGWLIFLTHDVCANPSPYGVTPELLESAILHAKARGAVILPVCEALDRLGVSPNRNGSLG